jgi:uncharacterized protein (TIGR00369 family)
MANVKIPPNCDVTFGFELVGKEVGRTTWTWQPDERWENPVGVVQGGSLGAFADTVMASTVVTSLEGEKAFVFTAESKVSYFRAVKPGEKLRGEGVVVHKGSRIAFAEATIFDSEDRIVARASSTWAILPRKDSPGSGGAKSER